METNHDRKILEETGWMHVGSGVYAPRPKPLKNHPANKFQEELKDNPPPHLWISYIFPLSNHQPILSHVTNLPLSEPKELELKFSELSEIDIKIMEAGVGSQSLSLSFGKYLLSQEPDSDSCRYEPKWKGSFDEEEHPNVVRTIRYQKDCPTTKH